MKRNEDIGQFILNNFPSSDLFLNNYESSYSNGNLPEELKIFAKPISILDELFSSHINKKDNKVKNIALKMSKNFDFIFEFVEGYKDLKGMGNSTIEYVENIFYKYNIDPNKLEKEREIFIKNNRYDETLKFCSFTTIIKNEKEGSELLEKQWNLYFKNNENIHLTYRNKEWTGVFFNLTIKSDSRKKTISRLLKKYFEISLNAQSISQLPEIDKIVEIDLTNKGKNICAGSINTHEFKKEYLTSKNSTSIESIVEDAISYSYMDLLNRKLKDLNFLNIYKESLLEFEIGLGSDEYPIILKVKELSISHLSTALKQWHRNCYRSENTQLALFSTITLSLINKYVQNNISSKTKGEFNYFELNHDINNSRRGIIPRLKHCYFEVRLPDDYTLTSDHLSQSNAVKKLYIFEVKEIDISEENYEGPDGFDFKILNSTSGYRHKDPSLFGHLYEACSKKKCPIYAEPLKGYLPLNCLGQIIKKTL